MKIKFKKGKAYPSLLISLRVMILTLLNSIKNKGNVKAKVRLTKSSLYVIGDEDQADVLKLYGFKSIRLVNHNKLGYFTSYTEKIMGFRKTENDNHFEFGLHLREEGQRLEFVPIKVFLDQWCDLPIIENIKWYYLPIPPYFGGFDNNKNGLGAKAPCDVEIELKFI